MKAIFGAVALLASVAGAADAKTVMAPVILGLHTSAPGVYTRSYNAVAWLAVNQIIPPTPMFTSVLARAWFPNPLTQPAIPHQWGGTFNARNWIGTVTLASLTPKTYSMTGTLSAWNPGGQAHLTFASDGTWSCSGNCNFYLTLPNRTVQSPYGWGSGTFTVATAPLPAGAFFGLSGLLALLGARGRRRLSGKSN